MVGQVELRDDFKEQAEWRREKAEQHPDDKRHLEAAAALGVDISHSKNEDAGKILADRITWFMRELKVPNGLRDLGYSSSDIPALVQGTLPQHRVTKLSPRPAGPEELAGLFQGSLAVW